ncbi:dirigent protein 11-like [Cryptomeria japonica]|uniref:dirigent protein 11-like n=1 Tax=Cryptomeria japonica TaxID=3369 RepID=UPI0027DA9E2D|nr:dirigent protein 11-like [Cryptomeria japonica]
MHDVVKKANPTAIVVAGVNGTSSELLNFGTVLVMDDLLTEGPSRFSSVVGRAKGLYASSDVKGYAIHMLFSVVFENKEYNGSTLEFHGTDLWTKSSGTEVSVVGGTGKLRYARGYSIVTLNADPDDYVGYVKFNTTFRVN